MISLNFKEKGSFPRPGRPDSAIYYAISLVSGGKFAVEIIKIMEFIEILVIIMKFNENDDFCDFEGNGHPRTFDFRVSN